MFICECTNPGCGGVHQRDAVRLESREGRCDDGMIESTEVQPDGSPSPLAYKVAEFQWKHDGGLRDSSFIPAAARIIQAGLEESARIALEGYGYTPENRTHWIVARGVGEAACGIEVANLKTTLIGDQATCKVCQGAWFGYKVGRAAERIKAQN